MIQWYMWYYMGGMNPLDAWYVDYKNMEETHLFWGILLRTFGLYSDAAVMGSVQAFTAIIAGILFLHSDESYKTRAYYLLVFLICMIGFAISGTRGALIVFIPMVIYVLLCRKLLLQVSLTIMGVTIIYVLVFTYLFQNVYTINRLRTAFNPEDASMRIRIETRNENEKYINTHLMGWGLGTTGYLGKRFYGLKNVIEDPDGSFLVYHAELGILGFIFYWLFNIFVFGRTFWLLYKVKVPDKLYFQILGVSCALLGLTFQGYTGQGMSTYVTNFAGPMLMGYMWLSKHWFKGEELPEFKSNII